MRLRAALGAAVLSLGLGTAAASATPPLDEVDTVVDESDVLSEAQTTEVEAAIDALADEHDVDLHVVFVDSFDGYVGPEWADQTFDRADLGEGDILLAVAVEDRRYGHVEETGIRTGEAERVAVDLVEPELRQEDWDGAAVAAAEGFGEAFKPVDWWIFGAIGAGIASFFATVGGAIVGPRVRRDRRARRSRRDAVFTERPALVELMTGTRELADRSEQEQEFVTVQLGEAEAERLRTARTEGLSALDSGVTSLAEVPQEPPRRLPKHETLGSWERSLESARRDLEASLTVLSSALARVDVARTLQRDTSRLDDLAATVTAQLERAGTVEQGLTALAGSPWLHQHVAGLVEHARTALRVAGSSQEHSATLLGQGTPGDAAQELLRGEEARTKADGLLDRAEDPAAELAAALEEIAPQEQVLRAALAEAEQQQLKLDDYTRRANRLGLQERLGRVDPARISQAVTDGAAALRAHPEDPPARAAALSAASTELRAAVAPALTLAVIIEAASASSGSSSGSSSSRRSYSSGSSSRSSSRSSSSRSSSRSRGGGRF